jgi:hypothetical protein
MVSVKAALPAGAEAGLRLVITGSGGVTVKTAVVVPPAVVTVTLTGPAVVIRLAGTTMLNNISLVAARGVVPKVIVGVAEKFEPQNDRVKAPDPAGI